MFGTKRAADFFDTLIASSDKVGVKDRKRIIAEGLAHYRLRKNNER